jgi:hypothetical protein
MTLTYVCGRSEADTRPGGGFHQKPKDLSACESEERGYGGVYATLLQSDTLFREGEGAASATRYT